MEVTSLGSKHALSNGREPEEVTDLVAAFEQHNKCKITLSCCLELHGGLLDLEWIATARESQTGCQEALSLDLVSVRIWGGAYKTLMGVVTTLLYQLDFALAKAEFDKAAMK